MRFDGRYYNTLIKYSLYEVIRFAGKYYNTLIKYSLYEVFWKVL
jgi:hypothetical protein